MGLRKAIERKRADGADDLFLRMGANVAGIHAGPELDLKRLHLVRRSAATVSAPQFFGLTSLEALASKESAMEECPEPSAPRQFTDRAKRQAAAEQEVQRGIADGWSRGTCCTIGDSAAGMRLASFASISHLGTC